MKEVVGGFLFLVVLAIFVASFFQLPEAMERYSTLSRLNVEVIERLSDGEKVQSVMDYVRTQSEDAYVLINHSDPALFPHRVFEPHERIEVEVSELYMWGMSWGKYKPKLKIMISRRVKE